MGLLDSAVEGLTLQKAIIEVIDRTKQLENKEVAGPVGRVNDFKLKSQSYKLKKEAVMKAREASTSKLMKMATEVTGLGLGESVELEAYNLSIEGLDDDVEIRRFEVQFNPSTLSISGSGGGIAQHTNLAAINVNQTQTTHGHGNEYIEMSVQLTFDDTNNLIAFPGDWTGLNISSATDAAMKFGVDLFKQKLKGRPSVQDTVEGFLGTIRNKYTRELAFCWGRMLYFGYVNRVRTKYTLFNPSGKPIRATVDLSIVCADNSVSGKDNNLGYWHDKYEEFFKPEVSLSGARNGMFNLSNFSR